MSISYIYSTLKVNKIEPSTVTIWEDVEFNLTIIMIIKNHYFIIGIYFKLSLIELNEYLLSFQR